MHPSPLTAAQVHCWSSGEGPLPGGLPCALDLRLSHLPAATHASWPGLSTLTHVSYAPEPRCQEGGREKGSHGPVLSLQQEGSSL